MIPGGEGEGGYGMIPAECYSLQRRLFLTSVNKDITNHYIHIILSLTSYYHLHHTNIAFNVFKHKNCSIPS